MRHERLPHFPSIFVCVLLLEWGHLSNSKLVKHGLRAPPHGLSSPTRIELPPVNQNSRHDNQLSVVEEIMVIVKKHSESDFKQKIAMIEFVSSSKFGHCVPFSFVHVSWIVGCFKYMLETTLTDVRDNLAWCILGNEFVTNLPAENVVILEFASNKQIDAKRSVIFVTYAIVRPLLGGGFVFWFV